MSQTDLNRKFSEIVQSFHNKCEEQHHAIENKKERERKKEQEQAKRKEDVIKKFDDTILKDLQTFFTEIKSAFSSPYLELVLDTHGQHEYFYIHDDDHIPAFPALALDANSQDDDDVFNCACYLFFVASSTDDSFELWLNNKSREFLCFGEHEDDERTTLQTYSFDDYDFEEIRGHIEKYLTEELSYLQENFKVHKANWDED